MGQATEEPHLAEFGTQLSKKGTRVFMKNQNGNKEKLHRQLQGRGTLERSAKLQTGRQVYLMDTNKKLRAPNNENVTEIPLFD